MPEKIPVLRDEALGEEESADYSIGGGHRMFGSHISLIPMPSTIQGARLFYGAKFYTQALPLVGGEAALVQNARPDDPEGGSFDKYYGKRVGSVLSDIDGTVSKIGEDHVEVSGNDGTKKLYEMYKSFPFNRKTQLTHTPQVKVGQQLKSGDLIASSNFTTPDGTLALGKNLLTAIIPYRGHDFEDAVVISEAAAKKLTSDHMYGYDMDYIKGVRGGKNHFVSVFANTFTNEQLKNMDEHGLVHVGSKIKFGDPIVLATSPRALSSSDAQLGNLHKVMRNSRIDQSLTWDKGSEGIVTDVERTDKGVRVNVQTQMPLQIGDKLVGRSGSKGIVSRIVPDAQMLRNKDGEVMDIVMNPMGIVSRVNPGRIYEMLLGKIAKKTGKPYILPGFLPKGQSWHDFVAAELKKNGLEDAETIFDPVLNRNIATPITTGQQYVLKLHHTAESKLSGRDTAEYSSDETPARGGPEGAKRISGLEIFGLLSHGATGVIRDSINIRGQKNEDMWKALRQGLPLPEPKVPFIYTKFLNSLKAGGIDVREKGGALQIMPMTDGAIDQLAEHEVNGFETLTSKYLEPVPGGLFDPGLTGGTAGKKWAKIALPQPMPNPVMEEPIRKMLDLTQKEFRGVLAGTHQLEGQTGPGAFAHALSAINMDELEEKMTNDIRGGRATKRDRAVKVLGYLQGLRKVDMKPSDWMLSKIPVIPPVFRPITAIGDVMISSDANLLYKDFLQLRNSYQKLEKEVGTENLGDERLNIYDSMASVFGLGDPINPKTAARGVSGFIRKVVGNSPKTGMFQSKVISKPQDVVGRGTIVVNPELSMDEIGIPEDQAWTLYRPFVTRRLARSGVPVAQALKEVELRSTAARAAINSEMKERPVIYSRAPSWHRYSIVAAHPKIVEGNAIHISPLVTKSMNADFDGDQMNTHVPVSDEAVNDAKNKLLPSKNLLSVRDFKTPVYAPRMEMILGLYSASTHAHGGADKVVRVSGRKELAEGLRSGSIKPHDMVDIPD